MATILPFTMHDHPRVAPQGDVRSEVIVFPRTDIRALRGPSAGGDRLRTDDRACKAPSDDSPA